MFQRRSFSRMITAVLAVMMLVTVIPARGSARPGTPAVHVVKRGDTLWDISRRYKVPLERLKRINGKKARRLLPGMRLRLVVPSRPKPKKKVVDQRPDAGEVLEKREPGEKNTPEKLVAAVNKESYRRPQGRVDLHHKVRRGDSLWRISRKYHVPIRSIRRLNRRKASRLRPGQHLLIRIRDFETALRFRPFLADWDHMEPGEGYVVKRTARAWGRPWAIELIRASIRRLHENFPQAPDVVVGDISGPVGGYIPRHLSHKTGRDVDIGYFVDGVSDLVYFRKVNRHTVDVENNWELISAFLATGRVEYIFMDWRLQRILYEYAQSQGVPQQDLDIMFQYPAGPRVRTGIIRYSRGHDDHLHLRFACPEDDKLCR